MAKYSRFDPRNKKKSRNKKRSIEKDIRIHKADTEDRSRYARTYVKWTEELDTEDKQEVYN